MVVSLTKLVRLALLALCALLLLSGGELQAQISRVGAWTTGLTHTAGAGPNRVLIFAAGYENAAATDIALVSVSYGGQPLTRICGESAGTTNRDRSELWYLNAAGLAAAVGNTFSVSWSSAPGVVMYAAATYINVNQAAPIEDRDSTFTNGTTNPITRTMSKSINGMVIGNYVCGNSGTYTWNNGFTEGFDQTGGGTATLSGGDQFQTTGGTVVVSATHSGPNRQAVAAVSLSPAANQPPVLAAIGPRSVNEGANLNFLISATDPDGTTPTFTSSTLPSGASLTGNGNGTATFNWTPTFAQSGSYNVTFRATDGSLVDTEIVAITVNNVNQAPVLAAIGPRSVNEGANLNFLISASDPDGTLPTFTSSTLPSGASLTGNGNGTATFNWTPTFAQSGSYNVTFRATDGSLVDTEIVAITVTNVNQPPVLAAIGPRSVNEGANLNFLISATDPDGTIPTFTSSALPSGASLTGNGNGTATFNWTPTLAQSGSYNVTFRATDGSLVDTEIVAITVNNVNQAPVLAAIGPRSVNEGVNLNFLTSATDPDGTLPTFTSSTLPSGASLTGNGNGTATFNWTPTFAQSGSYNVTFRATDGSLVDTEIVAITVNNVNQAPVLAAIGPRSGSEQVLLTFNTTATDPDGTLPTFTSSALPAGATYTNNGNGTATFNWTPTLVQQGSYVVTFRATDGSLVDTEIVTITISDFNQPPVLAPIGPRSVNEGSLLNFLISATDPDGAIPVFTSSALPPGATLTGNGNGTATFNWTPTFAQSGSYNVTFRATDGSLVDTEIVTITVNNVNQPPVLAAIGPKSVNEGVLLSFNTTATDPDGSLPSFTSSALPAGATYTNNGNGSATFNWTPSFAQAGSYGVTFRATDGSLVDTEIVAITVNNVNQPPVLAAIGPKSVGQGSNLSFLISATDPDGAIPTFTSTTLPSGASLTGNGNGTATFDWTPSFVQSGPYNVTFRASDGSLVDTEIVTITVLDVSLPPVLAPIGDQIVDEGEPLIFLVTATDPNLSTPSLGTSSLPAGASFTDHGDGSGTFNWTPDFTQAGAYPVTFRASDGALTDSEMVTITVINVNRPPVLAAIGPQSVDEGSLLTFVTTATDPDLNALSISTSALPAGASFVDHGDGTGTFDWTPDYTQSGVHVVTFSASDGTLADSESVTITVADVNQPPVLAPIGPQSTVEGVQLVFVVLAADPGAGPPVLTTSALPFGASFIDHGDGSGTFDWTPGFSQSGSYPVTFAASDGSLADSEDVVLVVVDAGNHAPVLAPIGPQSTAEGVLLAFGMTASDVDGTIPSLTAAILPAGAALTDHGNGTATFDWTPAFNQAGIYPLVFRASDGALTDSEIVSVTVSNVNRPPVWSAAGDTVILENTVLNRLLSAADPDVQAVQLTASPMPPNASFTDHGNGTATFSFSPNFVQAGLYPFTFVASDGSLTDTLSFVVAVSEAGGQVPVFDSIGPQTVNEGALLAFRVSAHDPESTALELVATGLPPNAAFVDSGGGVGGFTWTPSYVSAGVHAVNFLATDDGVPPLTTIRSVTITVLEVNTPPVLDSIGPRWAVIEKPFSIHVTASDLLSSGPQGLLLTTFALPLGSSFVDSGDGRGGFTWTPTAAQVGSVVVTFTVTDNGAPALNDQEPVTITVLTANRTPVLTYIGPKFVTEGQTLQFPLSATDADSTIPSLSMLYHPPTASLVDHLNGTGQFTYAPSFAEAGLRSVEVRAYDYISFDKEVVLIQVLEAGNQPPNATVTGPPVIFERDTLVAVVRSNDPDSSHNPVSMLSALPANATFQSHGDGTATFQFVPWFTQSGAYNLTFATSDGSLADTVVYSFTVQDAGNQAPFLHALGNTAPEVPDKSFREELRDSLFVAASDFDSTVVHLSATGLPTGATFSDAGNNVGRLVWQPSFSQAGLYQITLFARDHLDTTMFDSQLVSLSVTNFFPAPVWNPAIVKSYVIPEGAILNINMATIPIDTMPRIKSVARPANSTLTDNLNGTCLLHFQPSFFQAGLDSAVIQAYHPLDTTVFTNIVLRFTISNVPQAPAWRPRNDTSVSENVPLVLVATADDPDGTIPVLSAQALPSGAIFSTPFSGSGSATGRITWTPGFTQQGVYPIRLLASDGSGVDTLIVTVTVLDAGNQMPVFTIPPANATIVLPLSLSVHVRATDADATIPSLSAAPLPPNATFVDSGNGGGRFLFEPNISQADSVYVVTFSASDGLSVRQVAVTYTVYDFIRGDSNRDAVVTSSDVILLVNYTFKGGPAPVPVAAGDVDASGTINSSDIIYLVNFLFKSGPPPPP